MKVYFGGNRIDEQDTVADLSKLLRATGGYERDVIYPHPTTFTAFIQFPAQESSKHFTKIDEVCKTLSQVFNCGIVSVFTDAENYLLPMINSWGGQIIIAYGTQWSTKHFKPQIILSIDSSTKDIVSIIFTKAVEVRGVTL